MTAFLLDTNVISAARRPERQGVAFQNFLAAFDVGKAYLSSISIMEIRFGIQREEKRDSPFAAELSRWLDEVVLAAFRERILLFETSAAIRAGGLPTAQRRPTADAMIAAIALEHGLRVVTRNVADFEVLGVGCLDPWHFAEAP